MIHLIDLDNCLCDDEWRIPYILWQKTNPMERYHNYHLLGAFDNIANKSVLLQRDVEIVILTARPDFRWSLLFRIIRCLYAMCRRFNHSVVAAA